MPLDGDTLWIIGGLATLFLTALGVLWRRLDKMQERLERHHDQLIVMEPVRDLLLDAAKDKLKKSFGTRGGK